MIKIGIITIHNSPNYGACLQSFALYEYLRMEGRDVEIIDLHRPAHSDYIPSKRFKPFEYRFEPKLHKLKRLTKRFIKNLLPQSNQTDEIASHKCPPPQGVRYIQKVQ